MMMMMMMMNISQKITCEVWVYKLSLKSFSLVEDVSLLVYKNGAIMRSWIPLPKVELRTNDFLF